MLSRKLFFVFALVCLVGRVDAFLDFDFSILENLGEILKDLSLRRLLRRFAPFARDVGVCEAPLINSVFPEIPIEIECSDAPEFPKPKALNNPSKFGSWEEDRDLPLVAAAAAVLPSGEILAWSSAFKDNFGNPLFEGKTETCNFDPVTEEITEATIVDTNHDMFCPGTAQLNDRIYVTGGSVSEATSFYDVNKKEWSAGTKLNVGRGYHSMTVLGDGRVFTFGGSFTIADDFLAFQGGKVAEIWDPDTDQWTVLDGISEEGWLTKDNDRMMADNHYFLFQAPNGKLFHAGPSVQTHWVDVENEEVTDSVVRDRDQMLANAVMYDIGKILVAGGSQDYEGDPGNPVFPDAYVFDINNDDVKLTRIDDLKFPRYNANAVVTPNGQVYVFGGSSGNKLFSDRFNVFAAEQFDPQTLKWTTMEANQIPRNYHSVCLLMKDARIWCAGGGLCGFLPCNVNHFNYEIYNPPYLFTANNQMAQRPTLNVSGGAEPLEKSVGNTITVTTNTPCSFTLLRLGAVTHAVNNDARRLPLKILSTTGQGPFTYTLDIPDNQNLVTPGPYWLFANDSEGTPSEGFSIAIV